MIKMLEGGARGAGKGRFQSAFFVSSGAILVPGSQAGVWAKHTFSKENILYFL